MKTVFDVDYFIKFFGAIPEEKWCTEQFHNQAGQSCAMGHLQNKCLGEKNYTDHYYLELYDLFSKNNLPPIVAVNDNNSARFRQATPKLRIMAALQHIKDRTNE